MFVGMQSLVFKAQVGRGCVLEPKCVVLGVKVASGRYVPAGAIIRTQTESDTLPEITADYAFRGLNKAVVQVNVQLAAGYNAAR